MGDRQNSGGVATADGIAAYQLGEARDCASVGQDRSVQCCAVTLGLYVRETLLTSGGTDAAVTLFLKETAVARVGTH